MLKRLGHVLLSVAIVAAVGGHWTVLQTVAWTTMFADNLQTSSFTEAVEKTFDGNHPCGLCHAIKSGKKAEKKAEFSVTLKKLEFVSERPSIVFNPPQDFQELLEPSLSFEVPLYQPDVPPPRSLFA